MKIAVVLSLILCVAFATLARAACAGTPVSAFGAKGDGHTDDSAAIQSTISAAGSAGGGAVAFSVARYYTTTTFTVPVGVVLCGTIEGPFDVSGINPATTANAPTLLVTSTSGPFITLNGLGAGVTDLLIHYPNQVGATAAAPSQDSYPLLTNYPGTKVVCSTVTNAYNFLDIESGRVIAQDLDIGAFNIGVNIDHATLRNLLFSVYWDIMPLASVPSTIDNWVMSHAIAIVANRVDGLEVHDFNVFSHYAGILFTDSPDATQNPRCGYGAGSDIDLDIVQVAIIVTASGRRDIRPSST